MPPKLARSAAALPVKVEGDSMRVRDYDERLDRKKGNKKVTHFFTKDELSHQQAAWSGQVELPLDETTTKMATQVSKNPESHNLSTLINDSRAFPEHSMK